MMIDRTEQNRRKKLNESGHWEIPNNLDTSNFDFNWRPHDNERPYIHQFGTQWQRTGGPRYIVPEQEGIKYQSVQHAIRLSDTSNFKKLIEEEIEFDYSWHPDDTEPSYVYVFGNQWNDTKQDQILEYRLEDSGEKKYMSEPIVKVHSKKENWYSLIEGSTVDQYWRHDPYDPPYIYVWGNKWNDSRTEPTVEYRVSEATDRKYIQDMTATLIPTIDNWHILIDGATIDQSWRPNPYETPYIYVWGNQWNDAATEPTVEYRVPGAVDRKYINNMVAIVPSTTENWTVFVEDDYKTFDFSWRPNPYAPSQIYQWENNGPMYSMKDAVHVSLMTRSDINQSNVSRYKIETTLEHLIEQHPTEVFWALNSELNYDQFDFSWRPTEENFRHINVFGNALSKDVTTYYVNGPAFIKGFKEYNYIDDHQIEITTDIDMFYIIKGSSVDQYEELKLQFPKLQKTRYLNSWVDTINRCVKKATTKLIWILSSEVDYTDFKFDFYPTTWQRNMIHVFGTQWSHWGNTYMINTETFEEDTKYVKIIEHLTNINFVRKRIAKITQCLYDIVYIDHGNASTSLDQLKQKCPNSVVTILKYNDSYLKTLSNWTSTFNVFEIKQEHYLWVCSSLCDYSEFDFTWASDPFKQEQLHVFSSKLGTDRQKFGDTFLLNLNTFKKEAEFLSKLEDYSCSIDYIGHISAHRLPHPVIEHDHDSQVIAIKEIKNRTWPYYELINRDSKPVKNQFIVPNMWNVHERQVLVSSTGASRIVVPEVAIDYIHSEVYDYHNIQTMDQVDQSKPLDIIFFSNTEPAAEENFIYLSNLVKSKKLSNKLHWVKNVSGRVASQHAAANTSETSWYFLVNGKLRINEKFDFNWQPDRLQRAKHYIFSATNPVNGLEYGHQAIVANNRTLTLNTIVQGLDFTLDSPHEVVEMNCGVARFNTDPWTTWRTAFREVIKLSCNTDEASVERLRAWVNIGNGANGEWSIKGAQDAVAYYDKVKGNLTELMKSYDWQWLEKLYKKRYC